MRIQEEKRHSHSFYFNFQLRTVAGSETIYDNYFDMPLKMLLTMT